MVRHHNQAREAGLETEDGQVHHSMARDMYRPTVRFGVVFMLIAGVLLVITGDFQAKIMFEQQPMKMASAEALCETQESAPFSILTVGGPDAFNEDCDGVTHLIEIPYVTSVLATYDPNARSEEHTSELQSRGHLVCRLLLEKKKKRQYAYTTQS